MIIQKIATFFLSFNSNYVEDDYKTLNKDYKGKAPVLIQGFLSDITKTCSVHPKLCPSI